MKAKILKWLLIALPYILLGLLCFFFLKQCSSISDLKTEIKDLNQKPPKEIYKHDTIKVPKPYKVSVKPDEIIHYLPDTTKHKGDSIVYVDKEIKIYSKDNLRDSLSISKWYLLQYPKNDKLIYINLTKKRLELGILPIDGKPIQANYDMDMDNYSYRYNQTQGLTKTSKLKHLDFYPSLGYSYRPLNNLHDLDLSLNLKTTHFNYEAGLNGFYYPKFNTNPGWDVKLKVQYNF